MANTFLIAERDRWPLWLPVALGAGSGLYFALPFEPAPFCGWVALAAGPALATAALVGFARWPLALIATLLLGFASAKLNEMRLATPVLGAPVVSLEPRGVNARAVLGNLLAMPVMGLWVMPAAAVSVAAMPFGLEGAPLHLLGHGIDVMLAMGRWVAGLPGAVTQATAMPVTALLLMSLGGLWLVVWRRNWRWWGVLPVLLGVALAWATRPPDMLVASDARTVAIRGSDGLLHFVRKASDKYAARDWLRRDGDARDIEDAVGAPGMGCDGVGCVVKTGVLIAVSFKPESLLEDCAQAQIVVSAAQASGCKGPAIVIDQKAAAQGEGWRITLSPTPAVESVRAYRGERSWVVNTAE